MQASVEARQDVDMGIRYLKMLEGGSEPVSHCRAQGAIGMRAGSSQDRVGQWVCESRCVQRTLQAVAL